MDSSGHLTEKDEVSAMCTGHKKSPTQAQPNQPSLEAIPLKPGRELSLPPEILLGDFCTLHRDLKEVAAAAPAPSSNPPKNTHPQ